MTMPRMTGHFAMSQIGHTGVAEPDDVADGLGDRPAHDEADEHQGGHDDEPEGDEQDDGAQLPHRAALVDLVHPVHRPPERADVARGGPQSARDADDEGDPRAARPADLLDRTLELVGDLGLPQLADHVEQRRRRRLALPEDTEEGDEREDRREDRQHGVVGERGGEVGALVALELRGTPPSRCTPSRGARCRWGSRACGRRRVRAPCAPCPRPCPAVPCLAPTPWSDRHAVGGCRFRLR